MSAIINNIFSTNYNILLICILFSICLGLIIFGLSYFLAIQNPDSEKMSAYECGFEPFEDARNKFDVRFYIVAILFIIFDVEVIYLFP
jgi:NADH-quinone oxidoreductase subunit A